MKSVVTGLGLRVSARRARRACIIWDSQSILKRSISTPGKFREPAVCQSSDSGKILAKMRQQNKPGYRLVEKVLQSTDGCRMLVYRPTRAMAKSP